MHVILYKRHKAKCPFRKDKASRRCDCSIWMEWNRDGKQTRVSAKTQSWEFAQQRAQHIEQQHLNGAMGLVSPTTAGTVAEAIKVFMDSKRGEDLAANTLYKHTLTLNRLQSFCDEQQI